MPGILVEMGQQAHKSPIGSGGGSGAGRRGARRLSRQVGTALLYIRGWDGPRTRIAQKKSKYFENQITIYDLYYLNNNKYQKSFGAKPLFNVVLNMYGEPCTKFSKLSYKRKHFYDFPTTKLLAYFHNFDIFQQLIRNLVLNFQDFLVSQTFFIQNKKFDFDENWFCVKIPVFPSFFFLFFSIFLKTVGKCLLFTSIMHQGYSLFHRKPSPKFEIEALFRLVMLYTDTKKKTYIIVNSIVSCGLTSIQQNHISCTNI
ncbi:hypothetical protein AGLY_015119 [Aphis glycines]|uniref:Uncharacterized protein n=1 Tax=Aphis glycines TaxID=307491 RepID=A0A6G0T1H1_APHGL|nr:hypothetical protein AGLY_015119 [Aphis glycines]